MTKLAAALGVGPAFLRMYGYDAIRYPGRMEFTMELCEPAQNTDLQKIAKQNKRDPSSPHRAALSEKQQQLGEALIDKLRIMHAFHIVHGDVKVGNVVWSPSAGSLVFIDFDFACYVRNGRIGVKKKTGFFGTYEYTSPEMKKLFFLET